MDNKVPEWVWVIVEKKGQDENLLALEDKEQGIQFIPAFASRDDGLVGRSRLGKREGFEYELEAMRMALVAETARTNRFEVFILDDEGKIVERLAPMPDA